jgi:hypothetical protein
MGDIDTKSLKTFPHCSSCQQPIKTTDYVVGGEKEYELHNELYVILEGGYSSFVDTAACVGGKPYQYTLCHDCAVKLCKAMGFLDALRQHANMVECSCEDHGERRRRWDAEMEEQKADIEAYKKAKVWLDPVIKEYRKKKGEKPVT